MLDVYPHLLLDYDILYVIYVRMRTFLIRRERTNVVGTQSIYQGLLRWLAIGMVFSRDMAR